MESLLKELINLQMEALSETRYTNQLLTELNGNVIALIEAMGDDGSDPDALPLTDMEGNPI